MANRVTVWLCLHFGPGFNADEPHEYWLSTRADTWLQLGHNRGALTGVLNGGIQTEERLRKIDDKSKNERIILQSS